MNSRQDIDDRDEIVIEITDEKKTFNITSGICYFNQEIIRCDIDLKIPYTDSNKLTIGLKEKDRVTDDYGSVMITQGILAEGIAEIQIDSKDQSYTKVVCEGVSQGLAACGGGQYTGVDLQFCYEISRSLEKCRETSVNENVGNYNVLLKVVEQELCEPSCGEQANSCQSCSFNGGYQFLFNEKSCKENQIPDEKQGDTQIQTPQNISDGEEQNDKKFYEEWYGIMVFVVCGIVVIVLIVCVVKKIKKDRSGNYTV